MFAKIEDELEFDERQKTRLRKAYKNDNFITWRVYREDREKANYSEEMVRKGVKIFGTGLYQLFSMILILFILLSAGGIFYLVKSLIT